MSLFGSINVASNALLASQIGLQVTGQNISNVNTPGYAREEVQFVPAATQRIGALQLGLGVQVGGVVQKIDRFLEGQLRNAAGDRASAETQKQVYVQLEQALAVLKDGDLGASLTKFFSSIQEVLNQPESASVRNLAVLQGSSLAGDLSRLSDRVLELRTQQDQSIVDAAGEINRQIEKIRTLNLKIAEVEAGELSQSEAVGLRDERSNAMAALGELINVRTDEQSDGSVNIFVGGDFLVYGGISREVKAAQTTTAGLTSTSLQVAESDAPLKIDSGRVAGAALARDEILGGFADQLNNLAKTLAFEFNKVFSSGQGLRGYQSTVSEHAVSNGAAPLDAAGLPFTPVNGSFQIQVLDRRTGLTQTRTIAVKLNGLADDTTLTSLTAQLSGVPGITASVDPAGRLAIRANSPTQEFAFAEDTSGVLAALGVATFFSGTDARTLGVRKAIQDDPTKFSASKTGIGVGTGIAEELAGFFNRPLESAGGQSIGVLASRLSNETTERSAAAASAATGFDVYEQNLQARHLAITGVNLDEEAIKLLAFERAYQSAAKFITTVNGLLDVLLRL